jgi:hypothetical protein
VASTTSSEARGLQVRRGDAAVQHQLHPGQFDLAAEVAQRLVELVLARHLLGDVELAADLGRAVEQGHVMAALGGVVAKARPAGPAPTTAMRLAGTVVGVQFSVSWQARGLTRQEVTLPLKVWSRQAWLQPMQVLISSARPCSPCDEFRVGQQGRAIDTMSAEARRPAPASAVSGALMRLVVTSGIDTWPFSFCVTQAKAARGTLVAMVGTRASCQPMPVLMMVAPAGSMPWPVAPPRQSVEPFSTRSSIDRR